MRAIKLMCVLASALALGGCPTAGDKPALTGEKAYESRVYLLRTCPADSKPADVAPLALGAIIASAVIPALVEVSMDLIAGAVREAAKDKITSATAISTAHLHGFPVMPENDATAIPDPGLVVNQQFGCLVVVRGEFGNRISNNDIASTKFAKREEFLKAVGFAPSEKDVTSPDFYFAARIEFSDENSAFRLVPIDVQLNNYIGNQTAELVLNVSFVSARAGRDGTPLAIVTLPLPQLERTKSFGPQLLAGSASGWIAFPGGDQVAKAALADLQSARDAIATAGSANRHAKRFDDCKTDWSVLNKLPAKVENILSIPLPGGPDEVTPPDCSEFFLTFQRAALDALAIRPGNRGDAQDKLAPVLAARIALMELADDARRNRETAAKTAKLTATYQKMLQEQPKFTPVTIEVEIIETRKASAFMKAIADVLDKSKKGVGDALVASLSPAERAKRRAEEEQQTRTNRAAVATAEDNVRLKQAELDDLPATATRAERVRAENALRQAKIAANNAYLADGRGVPYPEAQP